METLIRTAGWCALFFIAQWMVRWAVRAELERAGLPRATRDLTEREVQEVMELMADGQLNAAARLRNNYRHEITQPE